MGRNHRLGTAIGGIVAAILASGCAAVGPGPSAVPSASATPTSQPSPTADPPSSGSPPPSPTSTRIPTPTPAAPSATAIVLETVVAGLTAPLEVTHAGDGSGRIFVVERDGRIRIVRDGRLVARAYLDIRSQVGTAGEGGLLGLAFHPAYPDDPRLFVNYTDRDGDTVVSSFTVRPTDPDRADPDAERVLLRIDQPFANHNGGGLAFDADGMLLIATGDGGGGGDPFGAAQRLDSLLGKILRIDVDATPASGLRYAIPPDNPFVDRAGARREIWHYGLRNPWRIRVDRVTGDLWIGDVGQQQWEEIDVAPRGIGGINFGWNLMEGAHCYQPPSDSCDREGLTRPVAEYGHRLGCAVTGGVVYRGSAQPTLSGAYLFSDSCSGRVWRIDASVREPQIPVQLLRSGRSITAIGEDGDGEAYATDIGSGELLRIVVADSP